MPFQNIADWTGGALYPAAPLKARDRHRPTRPVRLLDQWPVMLEFKVRRGLVHTTVRATNARSHYDLIGLPDERHFRSVVFLLHCFHLLSSLVLVSNSFVNKQSLYDDFAATIREQ